ncbi:MAG: glycosyltransferase [Clostridia bacterium]|nr:glycosyltransferase [Clostridia bacterium]
MKQVLNVCAKHPPFDGRVYKKIGLTLRDLGYGVHSTAPNAKDETTKDDITIHGFTQKKGILGRIASHKALYRLCSEIKPDVMIAHEPDALFVAYKYYKRERKRRKIKLIFDCHEAYEHWHDQKLGLPFLEKRMNQIVMSAINRKIARIDGVTSVNQTMTENFAKFNTNSWMLPSVPSKQYALAGINEKVQRNSTVFFGQFGVSRQKEMLLCAAEILKNKGINHTIAIIGGDGKSEEDSLFMREAQKRGVSEYFHFYGWMESERAYKVLSEYAVGMMRFDSYTMPGNYALPNKLFEYMAYGMAVIACSENIEEAGIIRESDCGVLIESETGDALAEGIIKAWADPDALERMRKNAFCAIREKYNWDVYGEVLRNIIERQQRWITKKNVF